MAVSGIDPARLFSLLLNTGLQTKDNPLYQVIYQLIGQVSKLTADSAASSSSTNNSTTVINQIIQQLALGDDSSGDGEVGPPGVRGLDGNDGANGMVPYFIASSEIFIIPLFKQALFAINIDNEGILEIDGFLIEVDGSSSGTIINNTIVQLYEDYYLDDD
jgi:hypothetical protein